MRDVAPPKDRESVSGSVPLLPHQCLLCSLRDGGASEMQKSQQSQSSCAAANPNSGCTQIIFWRLTSFGFLIRFRYQRPTALQIWSRHFADFVFISPAFQIWLCECYVRYCKSPQKWYYSSSAPYLLEVIFSYHAGWMSGRQKALPCVLLAMVGLQMLEELSLRC